MERESLLASIREIFYKMCNVSEDNSASDEFISQHHWTRIEDGHWRFNKSKPAQENGFEEEVDALFPKGIELDVYRFAVTTPADVASLIREIAKTFYDLEGKTYVFKEFESLSNALREWGDAFGLVATDQALAHCATHLVVKVYGDNTTALYLGFGDGGVVAFVFNVLVDAEDLPEYFNEF